MSATSIDSATNKTLPSAVLWDMDGTLVDTEPYWGEALELLTQKLGVTLSAQTREGLLGNSMVSSVTKVFSFTDQDLTDEKFAWARQILTDYVGTQLRRSIPWRPGAQAALQVFKDLGIPQALVTATERGLVNIALETIGSSMFTTSVCGDEVSLGKPHPEPYEKAASLLGIAPAECLAIEDSPTGSRAATDAGCSVLVVPSFIEVEDAPKRVFRDTLEGLKVSDVRAIWAHSRS